MAFSCTPLGRNIVVAEPTAPGQPYIARYTLPRHVNRAWIHLQYVKDAANLAITFWGVDAELSPVAEHLAKRNSSNEIVDDTISLKATKDCKIPVEIGTDTDILEIRILPDSVVGNDVLKIGVSPE